MRMGMLFSLKKLTNPTEKQAKYKQRGSYPQYGNPKNMSPCLLRF